MAASDRAMLHALTAPATGKTATAPTPSACSTSAREIPRGLVAKTTATGATFP